MTNQTCSLTITNDVFTLFSPSAKVTKRVPDLLGVRGNKTFGLSSISFAFCLCIRLVIVDCISVLDMIDDDDDDGTLKQQG